jgi:hypothetical protein
MPRSSRVIIEIDPPQAGLIVLTAQRTSHGIEELVTGLLNIGPWEGPDTLIEHVPRALATLCANAMPLFGFVMARGGTADLTQPPSMPHPPMTLALLIGPPGVRELGIDCPDIAKRFNALIAGRPALPGLVFPLIPGPECPPDRLKDIVEAIGVDQVRSVIDKKNENSRKSPDG